MKKLGLIVVLGLLLLVAWIVGKYNGMVKMDESVKEARAQVENQYQRRMDLIPNLVETVKGVAGFEKETYTQVTEARAKATQTSVNINDAESFAKFQASQGELSSALSRLMVSVENYPQLKANENFIQLQSQLEGTENRITVERQRYNEVVKSYNVFIRSFPNNFLAGIFGFEKAEMFSAEEGAETSPDVSFEAKETAGESAVNDLESQVEAKRKEIELEKLQQELDALKATGVVVE